MTQRLGHGKLRRRAGAAAASATEKREAFTAESALLPRLSLALSPLGYAREARTIMNASFWRGQIDDDNLRITVLVSLPRVGHGELRL